MPAAAVIHEEQALSTLTECIKYVGDYKYFLLKGIKTGDKKEFINSNL